MFNLENNNKNEEHSLPMTSSSVAERCVNDDFGKCWKQTDDY